MRGIGNFRRPPQTRGIQRGGEGRLRVRPEEINNDIEAIPYTITPTEVPQYRESIYRERAIAAERVRLAMGMSLRPSDKPVHLTSGLDQSNISDKYYEPPLMQVIPSACDACEDNVYEVSNQCRGCVAKACVAACPKDAISIVDGKSVIDREKCIRCGKCKAACPYDAIAHKMRPCSQACGIKAVVTDRARPREDRQRQMRGLRSMYGKLPVRRHRGQVADFSADQGD